MVYDLQQKRELTVKNQTKLFKTFLMNIKTVATEKDVETHWQTLFNQMFKNGSGQVVKTPHGTDGLIQINQFTGNINILMEFKHNFDLTSKQNQLKVLTQMIHYMYKLKDTEYGVPDILVGADENHAFVLYAPNFYKYLEDTSYNWDVAPSQAYRDNFKLLLDLMDDANTNTWVYTLNNPKVGDNTSNLTILFDEIVSLVQHDSHQQYQIDITPLNIEYLYRLFEDNGMVGNTTSKNTVSRVNLFSQLLTQNNMDYYQHPHNPNIIIANGTQIRVDGAYINALFKKYNRDLSPVKRNELVAIADRLLEDHTRQLHGEYWTPSIWANRSDEILQNVLGEGYKEDTLVWDPAAGASNLTRDNQYGELYISTLHDEELSMGQQYNQEAKTRFQYDFLNDDIDMNPLSNPDDLKLPNELFNALVEAGRTGRRVLFYANPPYGSSGAGRKSDKTKRQGTHRTETNKYMLNEGYGTASTNLYMQFFGRVDKIRKDFGLTNFNIGFFTPIRQICGGSAWMGYKNLFLTKYQHKQGILFNAGEFGGTANTWGVSFSVYEYLETEDNTDFNYHLSVEETELSPEGLVINHIGDKTISFVDDEDSIVRYVAEQRVQAREYSKPYPRLKNALAEADLTKGKQAGMLHEGALGSLWVSGSSIGRTAQYVGILNGLMRNGGGSSIYPSNFDRVVVGFGVREAVTVDWINNTDNIRRPNDELIASQPQQWQAFVNDTLVFSLFGPHSLQASYRGNEDYNPDWKQYSNTQVPGKWVNEFFWMSQEEILELANSHRLDLVYQDALTDTNRFVYNEIQKREFSVEAQALLDLASQVVRDTMPFRKLYMHNKEEWHLRAWDAGWYQIKQLEKEHPSSHMDDFREALKTLSDKIEQESYDWGMLV